MQLGGWKKPSAIARTGWLSEGFLSEPMSDRDHLWLVLNTGITVRDYLQKQRNVGVCVARVVRPGLFRHDSIYPHPTK